MKRLQCTGAPLKLRKFGTLCHVQLCPNPTCACSSWQFPRLASSPRPPLALPASPPRDCPSQSVHSSNDIWTFCYIGSTVADQPVPWKVAQLLSRTVRMVSCLSAPQNEQFFLACWKRPGTYWGQKYAQIQNGYAEQASSEHNDGDAIWQRFAKIRGQAGK